MAFTGNRYILAFNGSFNGNENVEEVPAGDFTIDSRNIDIHNGGAEKRGGTQIVGDQIAADISSLGSGVLVKRNSGSIHHYWAASNGKVYRNGVEILTGRSQTAKVTFTAADDVMFICNGVDAVKVDTGSAVATIATPSADWTGSAHPKWACLHSKGSSQRMFFGGVPGKEEIVYYSVSGTYEDMTSAGSGTKLIDGFDGFGAISAVSKDGHLFIFGRDRTYILDDSDSDVANWGHYSASFKGGIHSPQLVCKAENHIFAMNTEGNIYEVMTADATQNVKEASISEPFFIHNYIRNNIDLTKIDQFHMVYDPKIRALRLFLVRSGQTTVDTCLTWLVHQKKWVPPHDGTDNAASGFRASSSYTATLSTGEQKAYTQDYNGETWELSSSTKTDDGSAYTAATYSGWLDFDLEGVEKRYCFGKLNYRSQGDYELDIMWYVDGQQKTTRTLNLSSGSSTLGSFILDAHTLSVADVASQEFELGDVGEKLRISVQNDGAGNDFFLAYMVLFFQDRGVQRA